MAGATLTPEELAQLDLRRLKSTGGAYTPPPAPRANPPQTQRLTELVGDGARPAAAPAAGPSPEDLARLDLERLQQSGGDYTPPAAPGVKIPPRRPATEAAKHGQTYGPDPVMEARARLGDERFSQVNAEFQKKGIGAFAWSHNALRESGANPQAVGDGGKSHGMFQFYFGGGVGSDLERQYGKARALEIARDPVLSARVMAERARAAGVNGIQDPKAQALAFTERVERPAASVVAKVRGELSRMLAPGKATGKPYVQRGAYLTNRSPRLTMGDEAGIPFHMPTPAEKAFVKANPPVMTPQAAELARSRTYPRKVSVSGGPGDRGTVVTVWDEHRPLPANQRVMQLGPRPGEQRFPTDAEIRGNEKLAQERDAAEFRSRLARVPIDPSDPSDPGALLELPTRKQPSASGAVVDAVKPYARVIDMGAQLSPSVYHALQHPDPNDPTQLERAFVQDYSILRAAGLVGEAGEKGFALTQLGKAWLTHASEDAGPTVSFLMKHFNPGRIGGEAAGGAGSQAATNAVTGRPLDEGVGAAALLGPIVHAGGSMVSEAGQALKIANLKAGIEILDGKIAQLRTRPRDPAARQAVRELQAQGSQLRGQLVDLTRPPARTVTPTRGSANTLVEPRVNSDVVPPAGTQAPTGADRRLRLTPEAGKPEAAPGKAVAQNVLTMTVKASEQQPGNRSKQPGFAVTGALQPPAKKPAAVPGEPLAPEPPPVSPPVEATAPVQTPGAVVVSGNVVAKPAPVAAAVPAKVHVDADGRVHVEGRRWIDPRDADVLEKLDTARRTGDPSASKAVLAELAPEREQQIRALIRDLHGRGALGDVIQAHRDHVTVLEQQQLAALEREHMLANRDSRQEPQQLLADTLSGRGTRQNATYYDEAGKKRMAKYVEFDTGAVSQADREAMYAHVVNNNPALEGKEWTIPGFGKGKASLRDLMVDGGIVPSEIANRYMLGGKKGPSGGAARISEVQARKAAAKAELDAALQEFHKAASGRLYNPIAPDPDTMKAAVNVARALVKSGVATAEELFIQLGEHLNGHSEEFRRKVVAALEQEDGPIGKPVSGAAAPGKPSPFKVGERVIVRNSAGRETEGVYVGPAKNGRYAHVQNDAGGSMFQPVKNVRLASAPAPPGPKPLPAEPHPRAEDLGAHFDYATSDPKAPRVELTLGAPSPENAAQVKQLTDLDISGSTRILGSNDVWHTDRHHGVGRETRVDHVGVSRKDWQQLPQVIDHADHVSLSPKLSDDKHPVLIYQKRINGHIFVAEEVILPSTSGKPGKLVIKSVYKVDAKKGGGLADAPQSGVGRLPATESVSDPAAPVNSAPDAPDEPPSPDAGGSAPAKPPVPPAGGGGDAAASALDPGQDKYAGSINLDKLDVPEDVANLIRDTYSGRQPEMDHQRRGVRSEEDTKKAADKLLKSGAINLQKLGKSKRGTAYNAEEIHAIAELHVRLADDVAEAKRVYEDHNTTENLAALEEAKTRHYAVMMSLQGASAEAGRALQIHKKVKEAYRGMIPDKAAQKIHDPAQAPLFPDVIPPRAPGERTTPKQNPSVRRGNGAPEGFGQQNKVFTADRANAARERLYAKLSRTSGGLPGAQFVDTLPELVELGGFYLEGGARQFGSWAKQMRADLGEDTLSKEQLQEVWLKTKPATYKALHEAKQPAGEFQAGGKTAAAKDGAPGAVKPGKLDLGAEAGPGNGKAVPTPGPVKPDPIPGNVEQGRLKVDVFGQSNQVYREAPSYEALDRLRKQTTLGASATPDLKQLGGYYVEGGLRSFDPWAKQMKSDLGTRIDEPGLRSLWDTLKPETVRRASDRATRDEARSAFLKAIGGSEAEARDAAGRLAKIPDDDPVALTKFLRSEQAFTPGQKLQAYYKGNLLSGPKTHIRNFSSNLLHGGMKNAERYLTAVVDIPVSKLQGRAREYHLRDAAAGTVGYFQGVPQGFRDWADTVRHGFTADQARQLDIGGGPEFAGGAKNPYNFGQRMLAGADSLFKSMARESERAALATRGVLKEGLKGEAATARYQELLADPDVAKKAEDAASRWTFTDDPDTMAQAILNARRKLPGAHYVLPFFSTPWNVLKESVRYSPAGMLRLVLDTTTENGGKVAFSAARLKSKEASEIMAQGMIGTGIILAASAYARDGQITGAAPKDPNARDAFYRSGRQPYSLKIGDRWVSYQSLGPTTSLLGAVAAWQDGYWKKKQPTPGEEFIRVAAEVGKAVKEQSALTGLSAAMNALDDPEKFGEQFVSGLAGGMVPGSGLQRNVAQATDPTLRDARGVGERLQANTPGLSRKLPARLDNLGREVQRQPAGVAAMQPFGGSRPTRDPVDKELERLKVFPGGTGDKLTIDNKEVELSRAEEQEYQRRVGQATYAAVQKEIRKTGYPNRTDESKKERVNDAITKARKAASEKYRDEIAKQRGMPRKSKGLGGLGSLGSLGHF